MKNTVKIFGAILCISLFITSCGNGNQKEENTDSTKNVVATSDSEVKTVIAKLVSGGSLEGDADFVFQKEDGSTIEFYRNYMDPEEPTLKYQLIGEDGLSVNPDLVGKFVIIKYRKSPKGRISMVSGEAEPCNQILSIEMK